MQVRHVFCLVQHVQRYKGCRQAYFFYRFGRRTVSNAIDRAHPTRTAFYPAFLQGRVPHRVIFCLVTMSTGFNSLAAIDVNFLFTRSVPLRSIMVNVGFGRCTGFQRITRFFSQVVARHNLCPTVPGCFVKRPAFQGQYNQRGVTRQGNGTIFIFHSFQHAHLLQTFVTSVRANHFPLYVTHQRRVSAIVIHQYPPRI